MTEHDFELAISGANATLLIADNATGVYGGGVGVRHQGCDVLAEVYPELDCVSCTYCGLNDRVSGAWVVDMIATRSGLQENP